MVLESVVVFNRTRTALPAATLFYYYYFSLHCKASISSGLIHRLILNKWDGGAEMLIENAPPHHLSNITIWVNFMKS